ncbi:MAG: hypothetical protein RJA36_2821 [Pseudomonadota bacterium]|jgi:adhesin transport system outer membrane protein
MALALAAQAPSAMAQGLAALEHEPVSDARPVAPAWSLPRLIAVALSSHPSVRSQQALLGAAEAGVEGARWQYFPTPSVSVQSAGTASSDVVYRGDRSVTVLALSQPLWTWGRLDAGLDRSRALLDAARAGRDEAKLGLALRLVQAWGEWQSAQARQQALGEGATHHERLLRQVQRRLDEGQAASSDLGLAEGRLAALRADLAQAGVQEAAARDRLAVLSGQSLGRHALAPQLESGLSLTPSGDMAELLRRVQEASPALARLQAQLRVQQTAVAELEARLKPEVSARLEAQHGNFSVAGTSLQTRAFVAFNTQFGAGLSSVTAVTEALQRQESAQAEIEAQRLALAEQVAADFQLLVTAPARRADLVRAIGSADGVLLSWDRQYLAGRKTWQDLMGAAREQVQVRAQLAEFDAARLVAAWRLALLADGAEPLAVSLGSRDDAAYHSHK